MDTAYVVWAATIFVDSANSHTVRTLACCSNPNMSYTKDRQKEIRSNELRQGTFVVHLKPIGKGDATSFHVKVALK